MNKGDILRGWVVFIFLGCMIAYQLIHHPYPTDTHIDWANWMNVLTGQGNTAP